MTKKHAESEPMLFDPATREALKARFLEHFKAAFLASTTNVTDLILSDQELEQLFEKQWSMLAQSLAGACQAASAATTAQFERTVTNMFASWTAAANSALEAEAATVLKPLLTTPKLDQNTVAELAQRAQTTAASVAQHALERSFTLWSDELNAQSGATTERLLAIIEKTNFELVERLAAGITSERSLELAKALSYKLALTPDEATRRVEELLQKRESAQVARARARPSRRNERPLYAGEWTHFHKFPEGVIVSHGHDIFLCANDGVVKKIEMGEDGRWLPHSAGVLLYTRSKHETDSWALHTLRGSMAMRFKPKENYHYPALVSGHPQGAVWMANRYPGFYLIVCGPGGKPLLQYSCDSSGSWVPAERTVSVKVERTNSGQTKEQREVVQEKHVPLHWSLHPEGLVVCNGEQCRLLRIGQDGPSYPVSRESITDWLDNEEGEVVPRLGEGIFLRPYT